MLKQKTKNDVYESILNSYRRRRHSNSTVLPDMPPSETKENTKPDFVVITPDKNLKNHNIQLEVIERIFDLVAASIILLLAFPILIVSGILIKLDSPGPVLYKQIRIGKDGSRFILYKLRSMVADAEKFIGPVWASKNDNRVTKIGRFLRTTRIDELPQLFNVLRGDMSLVGPRPERPHFVKRYEALRGMRLRVKPGLTGLAQIRGHYDLEPNRKFRYDSIYIRRKSIMLDMYIMIKTIPIIFAQRGW